jgi:hypothetical protein
MDPLLLRGGCSAVGGFFIWLLYVPVAPSRRVVAEGFAAP